MVCDAVGLVVELAQRLVRAHARRPRDGTVPSGLGAKHGQQYTQPHFRDGMNFGSHNLSNPHRW
eukprot:1842805-Prymnesium_polylepis.1